MIEVVGDNEFVMIPEPETKVHIPVPEVATFPAITVVGEEIHKV